MMELARVRGCGLTVLSHMPATPAARPPPSDPQAMSGGKGRDWGVIKILSTKYRWAI